MEANLPHPPVRFQEIDLIIIGVKVNWLVDLALHDLFFVSDKEVFDYG